MFLYFPIAIAKTCKQFKNKFETSPDEMKCEKYDTTARMWNSTCEKFIERTFKNQFILPRIQSVNKNISALSGKIGIPHTAYTLISGKQQDVIFDMIEDDPRFFSVDGHVETIFHGTEYVNSKDRTHFYKVNFEECTRVETNLQNINCIYRFNTRVDSIKGKGTVTLEAWSETDTLYITKLEADNLVINCLNSKVHIHYLTVKQDLYLHLSEWKNLVIDILDLSRCNDDIFYGYFPCTVKINKILNPNNILYRIRNGDDKTITTNIPDWFLKNKEVVFDRPSAIKQRMRERVTTYETYLKYEEAIIGRTVGKETAYFINTEESENDWIISGNEHNVARFGTKVISKTKLLALMGDV